MISQKKKQEKFKKSFGEDENKSDNEIDSWKNSDTLKGKYPDNAKELVPQETMQKVKQLTKKKNLTMYPTKLSYPSPKKWTETILINWSRYSVCCFFLRDG